MIERWSEQNTREGEAGSEMEGIERDSKRQESEVYKTEWARRRGEGGGEGEKDKGREKEGDGETRRSDEERSGVGVGATKDVPCAGS